MNLPEMPQELRRTLEIYISELRSDLRLFESTLHQSSFDTATLKDKFHRIKGAASFFKFDDAAAWAKEAETLLSNQPLSSSDLIEQLLSICKHLEEHLAAIETNYSDVSN